MPIGVIVDAVAVALGGLLGAVIGPKLSEHFREHMNLIFGVCSMAMGIGSIVLMKYLPAVIFSVIVGTAVGLALHLGRRLEKAGEALQRCVVRGENQQLDTAGFVTAAVVFCASGTGIYGSIVSGISGDHSILITKAILDFCSSMIFACSLGRIVSLIAIPQCIIFLALFLLAKWIMPLTSADMLNDFKACGGIIMLATGFRIAKLRMFPITEMLPAMVMVMPVSFFWANCVLPLL